MTQEEKFRELITKYNDGAASEEEIAWLESIYPDWKVKEKRKYPEALLEEMAELMRTNINSRIVFEPVQHRRPVARLWLRIASAAACLLITISVASYFYNKYAFSDEDLTNVVVPGKNGATLTLSNGKNIVLSNVLNGELAKESGAVITKSANGQLVYVVKDQVSEHIRAFNQLRTAKGESYKIRLPDGSLVWLNAASSLKYPASFAGAKNRRIELDGEAYFEVNKDKSHPFIVKTSKQEITVLGTHFNVNSYADEPGTKTTLLEGSVKVTLAGGTISRMLVPGQQALLNGSSLKVSTANLEEAIAWKNGYFRFNDEKIESIMRKISRWYNVEVEYRGEVTQEGFYGAITRFSSIEQVLEIMTRSKAVHFKIEGRTIIVEN